MATKVINGRTFKAIPFNMEFVTYMEEHEYFTYATIGVTDEIMAVMAKEALIATLEVDKQLEEKQQGWNNVIVERVK